MVASPPPSEPASAKTPDRPLRVLVVDDHPLNRKVVEAMLSQFGAEVSLAVDGDQACRSFRAGSFDLVLMDIQMPVMDGLTATRTIRALEVELLRPRTPIMMLTANTLPEHVRASQEAGADRHLAKPIQLTALTEAVQHAMAYPA